MTRDEIRTEWEAFIEYPTAERTFVTTTSALMFSEYIAARATAREREACSLLCDQRALTMVIAKKEAAEDGDHDAAERLYGAARNLHDAACRIRERGDA